MSGKRRVTGLLAVTVSAAVLGAGGLILAATAQGDEIPAAPLPSVLPPSAPGQSLPTVAPPSVPPSSTSSTTPTVPATPPPGPNQPPDAGYTLGADFIWPGQVLTLKQTYLEDDDTPLAQLTQTIDWGDGTTQTVLGTTKQFAHRYVTIGSYRVRVVVSDGATAAVAQIYRDLVSVTDYMTRFELEATSGWVGKPVAVWHHSPSDAKTVQISWGDGAVSNVKATVAMSKATHAYAKAGVYTVTAVPANQAGPAIPRESLKLTIKADGVKPVAALKKPTAPTKGKSWATVRGTAADLASGVRNVAFTAIEKRGTAWYYWTGTGWKKAPSVAAATKAAKVLTLTPTATGAWSTKLTGVKRGTLRFTWSALDRAGNRSVRKTYDQKITS